MKRFTVCTLALILVSVKTYSQTLPLSFKTQYVQFSTGNKTGTSETNKPEKVCSDFLIANGNGLIAKNCTSNKIILSVKFINSDPTKYESNGSWSKRYFGYDPQLPSFTPDGTQNLSHVITIGYDSQVNSYSILIETPNAFKDVSFVWHYFNL
ncbi:MAG TPA: hypothetical protein VK498_11095 [Ferruginibacter sp.]|nr:hypothetical protein [Ferruginibacter sp.]